MSDDYRLELIRVGLNDKKNILGFLQVYSDEVLVGVFSTMEHGRGYVYLKVGSYDMEHSIKGNAGGRTRSNIHCLRPLEDRFDTLLIHDAYKDSPEYLSGCIAPFIIGNEAHTGSSAAAMNKLWDMLGGFYTGKGRKEGTGKITLVVLTNVQGDTRTKETWEWKRHKKRH